jgi:hypothetical protein
MSFSGSIPQEVLSQIPIPRALAELDDSEPITCLSWAELFSNAVNSGVPYYPVGVHLCENSIIKLYDGISLFELHKHNPNCLDFLTRLRVEKVFYLFIKTFDLDVNGKVINTFNFDGKGTAIPNADLGYSIIDETIFQNEEIFSSEENKSEGKKLLYSALNVNALEDKEKKANVGENEFRIAMIFKSNIEKLPSRQEPLRWLMSSAKHGCTKAAKFLSLEYLTGSLVTRNKKKSSKWGKKFRELKPTF